MSTAHVELSAQDSQRLSFSDIVAATVSVLARVSLSGKVAIRVIDSHRNRTTDIETNVSENPSFASVSSDLASRIDTGDGGSRLDCSACVHRGRVKGLHGRVHADPVSFTDLPCLSVSRDEDEGTLTVTAVRDNWISAEQFGGCLSSFLRSLSKCGRATPLGHLSLVTDEEEATLLSWAGHPKRMPEKASPPAGESLHETFFMRVRENPDRAVVFPPLRARGEGGSETESEPLTLRLLSTTATRLASKLREFGIGAGDRVGVMVGHEAQLPAVLVGVLASGAACVPVDPSDSDSMKEYLMATAQCRVCVTLDAEGSETCPSFVQPLSVSDLSTPPLSPSSSTQPSQEPLTPLEEPCDVPRDAEALVIFTSGSTGTPNGVSLSHWNLLNTYAGLASQVFGTPSDGREETVLWQANCRWILGISQALQSLLAGKRVSVCPKRISQDSHLLQRQMQVHGVTFVWGIPSMTAAVARAGVRFDRLRKINFGGEAARLEDIQSILEAAGDGTEVVNNWGMSEITFACETPVSLAESPLPAGRPMSNMRLFVLDSFGSLLPPGLKGTLWVSGPCLTRGYVNNETRNQTKFRPSPFAPTEDLDHQTLFCTDDMAAWQVGEGEKEGTLFIHGRADGRVRIRGQFVETAVVEQALSRQSGVSSASVLEVDGALCAVVAVSDKSIAQSYDRGSLFVRTLRGRLMASLPPTSIPTIIRLTASLPKTSTGKLDRKSTRSLLSDSTESIHSKGLSPQPSRASPPVSNRGAAFTSPQPPSRTLTEPVEGGGDVQEFAGVQREIATAVAAVLKGPSRPSDESASSSSAPSDISPTADIFSLGFHSLLVMPLVQRLAPLGLRVSDVFETPSVKGMTQTLMARRGGSSLLSGSVHDGSGGTATPSGEGVASTEGASVGCGGGVFGLGSVENGQVAEAEGGRGRARILTVSAECSDQMQKEKEGTEPLVFRWNVAANYTAAKEMHKYVPPFLLNPATPWFLRNFTYIVISASVKFLSDEAVDVEALEKAVGRVMDEHPILESRLLWRDGKQRIPAWRHLLVHRPDKGVMGTLEARRARRAPLTISHGDITPDEIEKRLKYSISAITGDTILCRFHFDTHRRTLFFAAPHLLLDAPTLALLGRAVVYAYRDSQQSGDEGGGRRLASLHEDVLVSEVAEWERRVCPPKKWGKPLRTVAGRQPPSLRPDAAGCCAIPIPFRAVSRRVRVEIGPLPPQIAIPEGMNFREILLAVWLRTISDMTECDEETVEEVIDPRLSPWIDPKFRSVWGGLATLAQYRLRQNTDLSIVESGRLIRRQIETQMASLPVWQKSFGFPVGRLERSRGWLFNFIETPDLSADNAEFSLSLPPSNGGIRFRERSIEVISVTRCGASQPDSLFVCFDSTLYKRGTIDRIGKKILETLGELGEETERKRKGKETEKR